MCSNLLLKIAPELSFRLVDLPDQIRPSVAEFFSYYVDSKIELSQRPLDVRFTKKTASFGHTNNVILTQPPVIVRQSEMKIFFDLPGIECWWDYGSGDAGVAVIELSSESIFHLTRTVLVSLFFHLSHKRGWLGLHAAAVVIADKAIVLTGPSGAGKTTLFQNAYRAGLGVLSDDLLWLRKGKSDYRAFAFPRGTELEVPHPTHNDVAVAALILPKIVNQKESKIFPMPVGDVAGELGCQAALLGSGEWAGTRFKELLRIIASIPSYRLTAGFDRVEVPGLLTELAKDLSRGPAL